MGNTCHCYAGSSGSDCSSTQTVNYAAITNGFSGAFRLVVGLATLLGIFASYL